MLYRVEDSVSGSNEIVEAKTPKQALIKFLKQEPEVSNVDIECSWDIIVSPLKVIK